VKKSELEHVIRAAKEITGETEFVVVGSQALHGAFPNLVDKLITSHECDIYIPNAREKTELLNSIGMLRSPRVTLMELPTTAPPLRTWYSPNSLQGVRKTFALSELCWPVSQSSLPLFDVLSLRSTIQCFKK
jgi:hypothetical protein